MRDVLVALASALLTIPVAAQGLVSRVHDLRPLLRAPQHGMDPDQTEPFLVPLAFALPGDRYWDEDSVIVPALLLARPSALGRRADAYAVRDWLVAALHADRDPGTLRIDEVRAPGTVLVEASAETQDRFERRLAELGLAALRPLDLELIRLPGAACAALPAGRAIDAAALDTLLDRFPPLGIWRRGARTGVATVLRSGETRAYLRDAEVEVASEETIADPKMDLMQLGVQACVQIARGPRDGAFIDAAIRSTRCSAASRKLDIETLQLDLPAIDVELFATRVFLDGDGAFAIGADEASTWIVRVRGVGGVRPDVVSLGGVERLPWLGVFPGHIGMRPLDPPGFEQIGMDDSESGELPWDVREAMEAHDVTADAPGLLVGDAWVAVKESASVARVRRLASAHAVVSTRVLRYAVVVAADARQVDSLMRDGGELGRAADAASIRGRLTVRDGDLAVTFLGTIRTFVRDHDVEIAQDASLSNPVVDHWFEGVALRLALSSAADGRIHVRGDVGLQSAATGPQSLGRRAFDRGPLDAPRVDHARVEVDQGIAAGAWQLVELAPFGSDGKHLAVLLRVDG